MTARSKDFSKNFEIEIIHPRMEIDFGAIAGTSRILCLDQSEFESEYGAQLCFDEMMQYVRQSTPPRPYTSWLEDPWPYSQGGNSDEIITWPDGDVEDSTEQLTDAQIPHLVVLGAPAMMARYQAEALIHEGAVFYPKPPGYDKAQDEEQKKQILRNEFASGYKAVSDTDQERAPQLEDDLRVYAEPPYPVDAEDLQRLLHRAQAGNDTKIDD